MITHEEIRKLAHLARIAVTDDEVAGYAKDFQAILGYVDQINQVPVGDVQEAFLEHNRVRLDQSTHAPGTYTDDLVAQAPQSVDDFYKVPKILSVE